MPKPDETPLETWTSRGRCLVCENEATLIADTGLCAACCFGEAEALKEYGDDDAEA